MSVAALDHHPSAPELGTAARLEELRAELVKGRRRMVELDRERLQLRDTLLRIGGAIQVLEELTGTDGPPS